MVAAKGQLRAALGFILDNFAAPIGFYALFITRGVKPAIALAVLIVGVQLFFHWLQGKRLSPIFMVAAGFTAGLGTVDLLLTDPRYFRLEPFGQNLVIGLVTLGMGVARIPVVRWFADALPARIRPGHDAWTEARLLKLPYLWGAYFLAKAFLFLHLAYRVDLGELVLLRSVIGGGTLVLLVAGEVAYQHWHRHRRLTFHT
jgi:intracellular septation protein A